ncbi:MAG: Coenzyme F420 hydrogenase/dehydrogenase, beta subunit C-terminal domain [Candidatus Alkanophagales archaeon]
MSAEGARTEGAKAEVEYVRLPRFLERGFADLKEEVIEAGRCCLCGTCAAFCGRISVRGGDHGEAATPSFDADYDVLCGLCYTLCPRTFLEVGEIEKRVFGRASKEGEVLGVFRRAYAVRATDEKILERAQDGGAVTALLAFALSEGVLDCAVVTGANEAWENEIRVVGDAEELIKSAGTKYVAAPSVLGVRDALEAGYEKIGFVGTPCQIQALRKVQTLDEPYRIGQERIKLLLGLFCMEGFKPALMGFVARLVGDPSLRSVKKLEIKRGRFWVHVGGDGAERVFVARLDEIRGFAMPGCAVCTDFTAELADVSVGSVGTPEGFSTVLVRSELGERLVEKAAGAGYIEVEELEDLRPVEVLARRKRSHGQQAASQPQPRP